ncbi:MAG: DegT/DnrJ/EryC1/StrS family aminotransferase [archaeon]
MEVPFLDLKTQYHKIRKEILAEIEDVLENSSFVLGPKVKAFEENFSKYCQVKHSIGLSTGTDALMLALLALDIKPGDEVLIPANTFIATAEAVSHCGAKPVFVDVDPVSYTIDPVLIEKAITNKTRAIIPVHIYGQMAEMDQIMNIAKKHKLFVIEDACQAHGAKYKGKMSGSIGDIGCFSFYPGKNLGAYGEGGLCVTNNDEFARKIRLLRDHGSEKKYYHDTIGYNSRLHGIQGAVLNVKLKYLDGWNLARAKAAELYSKKLGANSKIIVPKVMDGHTHIFHLFVVQVDDRDAVMQKLKEAGITALIHYPVPIHLQKAYESLGYKEGAFPVTEKAAKRILSLPIYPEITEEQVSYVCDALKKIV